MKVFQPFIWLALVLLFITQNATANQLPKLAANILTTDDCFTAYAAESSRCELSYCLGSVSGDANTIGEDKFQMCSSSPDGRQVAATTETN